MKCSRRQFLQTATAATVTASTLTAVNHVGPRQTEVWSQENLPSVKDIFRRENLIAWCIVPFDDRERSPLERAQMLKRLGLKKFAYDYRQQHVPHFEAEILACQAEGIELSAWWFPTTLNEEAHLILRLCQKHNITPQLWVTGGGSLTKNVVEHRQRLAAECERLRPLVQAAAEAGCQVSLYNHGGWFGEPEHQLEILEQLKAPHVGLVYNLHHGHDHLERFPQLLQQMKPHLHALNLNGMIPNGDRQGQKILPLGAGTEDLQILKMIQASGYQGPLGILNHTTRNAEHRLQDQLTGLDWLLAQMNGDLSPDKASEAKPRFLTYP